MLCCEALMQCMQVDQAKAAQDAADAAAFEAAEANGTLVTVHVAVFDPTGGGTRTGELRIPMSSSVRAFKRELCRCSQVSSVSLCTGVLLGLTPLLCCC